MVGLGDAGFDFDRTAISRDATPGATVAHSLLHGIAGSHTHYTHRRLLFPWGYLSL
jgi:hypothetical protein